MKKLLCGLFVTLALGGCASNTIKQNLEKNYKSVSIDYPNANLRFMNNFKVAGNAGINNYFGEYTVEKNNGIKIEIKGTTMMAGPINEMNNEKSFIKVLDNVDSYKIDGNYLYFYEKGKQVLKFVK